MTSHGHDAWTGLALVVGTGGIGSAITARLKQTFPGLRVMTAGRQGPPAQDLTLDIERDEDLAALSEALRAETGELRLVINATGRLHGPGLVPEKRLNQLERCALVEQFSINAIAVLLARSVESLLHRVDRFIRQPQCRVGSIGDNRSGGWYNYRAAKAAQNQLLKTDIDSVVGGSPP